jgi:SagB-type dehydrogenase family enzyme
MFPMRRWRWTTFRSWRGRRRASRLRGVAAVFDRSAARYGKRAERYVYLETGHAAQNLLREATSLGLGATPIGTFDEAEVTRLLQLPVAETPLYLIPVGKHAHP